MLPTTSITIHRIQSVRIDKPKDEFLFSGTCSSTLVIETESQRFEISLFADDMDKLVLKGEQNDNT